MHRVLNADGVVALSEPGQGHAASPTSIAETAGTGVLENELVIEDLAALAQAVGFREVNVLAEGPTRRYALVLARFVRGLSTHQGSGCLRRLRTAATAAKCHRAPVDSHRVADQMPTGPSMSRRRAPHAASPLPRG